MKHVILILFIALVIINCQSTLVNSQSLSPKVIPSCGGYFTDGGNSLSWTMGETFYTTMQNGNIILTQGEQQPYILLKILNLKAFIEGLYLSGGQMQAVLSNSYPMLPPNYCDSITVELHSANSPYNLVASNKVILLTDGSALVKFPSSLANVAYYIAFKTRNAIETWSKNTVSFNSASISFDFTSP